jgi:hypothetical protein
MSNIISQAMVEQLIEKEGWIISDVADSVFLPHLKDMFNAQNFFYCFNYMKEYVDFEGSSDRGRWYMKSIFINLGISTFRWIKAGKTKDARDKLLTAYDACALDAHHDDITLDDFQRLTQRYRNQRERKKRDFSEVNREFVELEDMPQKSTPLRPADHRSTPLDKFDESDGEDNG